jgi:hypothetical protein
MGWISYIDNLLGHGILGHADSLLSLSRQDAKNAKKTFGWPMPGNLLIPRAVQEIVAAREELSALAVQINTDKNASKSLRFME